MSNNHQDEELAVGDSSSMFFLEPAFTPQSDNRCAELLSAPPSQDTTLLFITFTQSAESRLEAWQSHVNAEMPSRLGFVDLKGSSQTRKERSLAVADRPGSEIRVETVKNPGNLTKIGIVLSTYISEWAHEGDRIVLCFDSLTALLQFTDVKPVYRFIRELSSQLHNLDALAHYHLDPDAHDEQVVNRLMSLFDAVVEPDEKDKWRVRSANDS